MVEALRVSAEGNTESASSFLAEHEAGLSGPKAISWFIMEAFEKSRLKELAKAFPEYQAW